MLFVHDTAQSLRSAVDLVNSGEPPDTLTTVEQLNAWDILQNRTVLITRSGLEALLA